MICDMLIEPDKNIWEQTITSLTVGKRYIFSVFLNNIIVPTEDWWTDPDMILKINGVQVTPILEISEDRDVWVPLNIIWQATSSTATLSIRLATAGSASGKDLALDDISFRPVSDISSIISTTANASCTINSATVNITGGVPPFTPVWSNGTTGPTLTGLSPGTYFVTVTDASGCSTTTGVTINSGPSVPINGDLSFCQGENSILTASDGFTNYLWSTGESTQNISVNSTGTYSVTATNSGCQAINSVNVTANPIPVISLSPATVAVNCSQTTTLIASGATTYLWSPLTGLNTTAGSTVIANPTMSTTYTVTGTSFGCSGSRSATVKVNPPVISVSGSASTICSGGTASLTASGATNYSWSPATGLSSTTGESVTATLNATTTYTVTGTSPGCPNETGTVTITVDNTCCAAPQGGITLTNSTASALASLITGSPFTGALFTYNTTTDPVLYINGTFTIDIANFNIAGGGTVYLGPKAKIVIPPHTDPLRQFILRACTLQASCNQMWEGIFINGNNSLFVSSYLTGGPNLIRDAETAVVSINGGQLNLKAAYFGYYTHKFLDNYKDIVILPYSGALIATITGTLFATSTGLIKPRLGQRTNTGIEISGITNIAGIKIGLNNGSGFDYLNTFDNMDIGVKTSNSITGIVNNTFQNITQPGVCIPAINKPGGTGTSSCPVYAAIWGLGDGSIAMNKVSVGGTNSEKNLIKDCTNGIFTDGIIHLITKNNQFTNIVHNSTMIAGTAIRVRDNKSSEVTIKDNKFNKFENGVHLLESSNMTVDISTNKFNFAVASDQGGIAIQCKNATYKSQNTSTIKDNKIERVSMGVWITNWPQSSVMSNDIILSQLAGQKRGILIEYSNARVIMNNISVQGGPPGNSTQYIGISVRTSPLATVTNNVLTRMSTGISCFGSSNPMTIGCNIMNFNYWGIYLNGATIGNQGAVNSPNDNQWQNQGDKRIHYTQGGAAPNWYWRNNGTNKFKILPFTASSINPQPQTCNPSSLCPYLCSIGSLTPDKPNKLAEKLQEQIQYPLFQNENDNLKKEFIFAELKRDNTLMQTGGTSDAVLQQFYTDHQQTNIAKIEETKIHIEQEEIAVAVLKNNSLSPGNVHEQNYKTVHEIYLESWAQKRFELEETERSNLKVIAEQNSLEGGRAVFTARVMLDTLVEDEIVTINPRLAGNTGGEKLIEIITFDKENFVTRLYPNPSDGIMQLDYKLAETGAGKLIIFDLNGRQVSEYTLNAEDNYLQIKEHTISNGLYFYEIRLDDEVIVKEKLIIIK